MNLDKQLDELLDKYYAPIKLPDNNRAGLKQAIKQLFLDMVGEDEEYEGTTMNWAIEHHNVLRAELRNQIKGDK